MRKINPEDVRADFALGLADVTKFYTTAHVAIASDRDRTFLVESTLLSVAVIWEGYISDLFLAYINRDPTQFTQHLHNSLNEALNGKPKRIFNEYGNVSIPRHLTKNAIISLIDPRQSNITFPNYDELAEASSKFLVLDHRRGIACLSNSDRAIVDALISVRNHIAHRSEQSFVSMNNSLNAGPLHPTGLRRGENRVRQIGSWLKSKPSVNQPPRIELFITALGRIAALL